MSHERSILSGVDGLAFLGGRKTGKFTQRLDIKRYDFARWMWRVVGHFRTSPSAHISLAVEKRSRAGESEKFLEGEML
jgi:hypothetical protein